MASWSDPELARAAEDVRAKISSVLPDHLREEFVSTHLIAPEHHYRAPIAVDMAGIRKSIRLRRKVRLDYEDDPKMGASGLPDLDNPMPEIGYVDDRPGHACQRR